MNMSHERSLLSDSLKHFAYENGISDAEAFQ